ncbi:MAG: ferritin [Chitinophagales bacterium]
MESKKLEKALNQQIKLEASASYSYLAKASWCEQRGLNGCAKFFYAHSEEERQHMLKVFKYLNDIGGHSVVPALDQPKQDFKNIKEVVEHSLKEEQEVTQAVHDLSELSSKEKAYGTYNFVQFYVDEQREEEILFANILEKIELIGLDGMGAYYIDKELEELIG